MKEVRPVLALFPGRIPHKRHFFVAEGGVGRGRGGGCTLEFSKFECETILVLFPCIPD